MAVNSVQSTYCSQGLFSCSLTRFVFDFRAITTAAAFVSAPICSRMRIATAPTGLETGVNLTCNPAYQALTLQGSGHNFHVRPHLLCATDYSLSHSMFSGLITAKPFLVFIFYFRKKRSCERASMSIEYFFSR